jgi:mannose-6-phosphate isomerase-like protein (cupin superfamily)
VHTINLAEKLSRFTAHWTPHVVAELNGQMVKVAKIKGAFDWHHHEHEDELFLVLRGHFRLEFRDHAVDVREGELVVVPRGVEHRPVADEECHILLFEPAGTRNTGNLVNERTRDDLERL